MTPGNWTPVGPPDGSGNVVVDNGGTAVLAPGSGTYGGSTINLGSTRGTGALVVTGATLTTGGLSIGDNNTGSLTLNNATVSAGYYNVIDIGLGGNGNGLVTINGGSLISNQYLNVGSTGKGTLILNSGQVQAGTNWSVRIGEQAGSNGHVIVNGGVFRGSVGLDNFVVGRSGVGLLEVHNNGIVNTSWTFVGGEYRDGNTPTSSGGTGTIILNDDALLTSADGIVIGGQGSKGDVTANDRSRITSSVDIYVGYGGPGTLTLNGAQASATGSYYVGYTGQGVLTLDGGRASGARAIIGSQGGSTGTLRITNGGVFTIDGGTVGSATNAVGSALVSGAGSEWRVNGILYFGGNGQGTLTLQNGGKATVTSDISLGPGAGKGVVNIGSAAGQAPVAPGTVDGPSVVFGPGTAELNFNHTSANYVFSPALNSSAAGTQSVSNYAGKTTLTGGNANYQGRVNVYGGELAVDAAATTSTQNLGTGGIFIDRNGLLTLNTTGALVFTNVLTGTGTLQASNGGQSFSFGAGVGSAYAGAVKLGQNRFELGDASGANANTAALTNATLVLQAGNTTDVGQGSQAIGGLIIDGGTLNFDVTTPSASVSNSTIDTSGLLHAGRVGNVGIVLPPGVDIKNYTPTAPGTAHLFDQQKGIGGVDIKLVNSLGSLSGTGANLVLVDQSSNVITDAQVANLLQGGVLAAEATYDYRLHTGRQDDGLYAGYGLTQLNLIGTGADALLLNLSGASGLVNNLDVKVTGVGDLAVDALSGRFNVISLSGTHNDYTGVTDVRTGTLLMANPNVLGKTAELLVQGGAIADLAGYNQSVGKLTTSAGSAVHLDGATLTVTDAQRQAGDTSGGYLASNTLFGPGQLVIDPSVLAIDGQQSGFAGSVTVTGGSTVVLNTADALDTAVGTQGVAGIGVNLVTAADRLVFGDLSQRTSSAVTGFQNGATTLMIAGAGQVQVMDKADVTFLKDMTYTGGTTIGAASRLQLGNGGTTGSIIGNVANSGTLAFNRADDITFAGVISGSGGVTQDGAGTTMLSGANTYREARQIKQGVLAAGAANVFSPNSAVTVGAAGMMKLLGLPQTVGGMNNAGVVDLGGAPGTVLTVSNNYASNGGSLLTRVALGNDSSVADKVVAGSVTVDSGGATRVFVSNAGGLGALTANDGIELVHVTGGAAASAVDAFVLGSAVKAGAYEYQLVQHGVRDANGNWYLRSSLDVPVDPVDPVIPTDPYRPEVPVYMSSPGLASRFGLAMLGTCDDRSGAYVDAMTTNCGDAGAGKAVWGRLFGQRGNTDFAGSGFADRLEAFASKGPAYHYTLSGFQTGVDLYRSLDDNNAGNIAGVYFGAGQAQAKVDQANGGRVGRVDMDAYSAGAYFTRRASTGWYVDVVAQATRYGRIKAKSDDGERLRSDGWGYVGSLETGYPIALSEKFSFIPQAQLIYQHVSLTGGSDSFGSVDYRPSNALYGRVGGKLSMDLSSRPDRNLSAFARANLWQDFGAKAKTEFNTLDGQNPVLLKTKLGGSWAQVGAGITGQVGKSTSLYTSIDYNFPIDSGKGSGIGAMVGFKYQW